MKTADKVGPFGLEGESGTLPCGKSDSIEDILYTDIELTKSGAKLGFEGERGLFEKGLGGDVEREAAAELGSAQEAKEEGIFVKADALAVCALEHACEERLCGGQQDVVGEESDVEFGFKSLEELNGLVADLVIRAFDRDLLEQGFDEFLCACLFGIAKDGGEFEAL